MKQKKVCMLGGFAVGKTSLVSRFVHSMFSDKYLTTVGVTISKKGVQVDGDHMDLVLWDIYGQDDFQAVRLSYVRGAGGYLLVADGTRGSTLETACLLQASVVEVVGSVPFVLLINKSDLVDEWQIGSGTMAGIVERGWTVVQTSAKTGDGVEEAFMTLARKIATDR